LWEIPELFQRALGRYLIVRQDGDDGMLRLSDRDFQIAACAAALRGSRAIAMSISLIEAMAGGGGQNSCSLVAAIVLRKFCEKILDL
jgi:hypothetical protein